MPRTFSYSSTGRPQATDEGKSPRKQMVLKHRRAALPPHFLSGIGLLPEAVSSAPWPQPLAGPDRPPPPSTHLKRPPQCWHWSPTQPAGQTHCPVPGLQRPPLTQGRSHSLASATTEPDTTAAAAAASAAQGSSSRGGSSSRSSCGRRSPAPSPGLPAPVASQRRSRPPFLPAGAVVAAVLFLSLASVAAAAATIFPGLRRRPANTYTPHGRLLVAWPCGAGLGGRWLRRSILRTEPERRGRRGDACMRA